MFGIGPPELLVIFLIILILFGAKTSTLSYRVTRYSELNAKAL